MPTDPPAADLGAHGEQQTAQVNRADLARGAREHYERISMAACDWYSLIPQAIDVWERLPELEAEINAQTARLAAAEQVCEAAVAWARSQGLISCMRADDLHVAIEAWQSIAGAERPGEARDGR